MSEAGDGMAFLGKDSDSVCLEGRLLMGVGGEVRPKALLEGRLRHSGFIH